MHTQICLGKVVCVYKWSPAVYFVQLVFNLTVYHRDNSLLIHVVTLLPYLIVAYIPLWEYIIIFNSSPFSRQL